MISCMGGFCSSRDKCADYHRGQQPIVERLCGLDEEPDIADKRMETIKQIHDDERAVVNIKSLRGRMQPVRDLERRKPRAIGVQERL